MRCCLLAGAALVMLAWPATAHGQSGGASVPGLPGGGGYQPDVPTLTASRFSVTPHTLRSGAPARFRYRIDGPQRSARVRIELVAVATGHPAARIRMGWKRTGRTFTRAWTPRAGVLTPGAAGGRLHAGDRDGGPLRRTATASGRPRLSVGGCQPARSRAAPRGAPNG